MLKLKPGLIQRLAITALAVMLFSVLNFAPGPAQATLSADGVSAVPVATVAQDYLIKLNSADASILNSYGTHIQHKFAFSQDPQFQNIYSFSSSASLSWLQQQFRGQYELLDIDQPVATQASASLTPDDPGFTNNPADIDRQWALPKATFAAAWRKTTGSSNTVVAIIDTGVDQTHTDLRRSNFAEGINILTGEEINVGTNSDDNGHGTLVAGIINARPNNSKGIAGAIWEVTILPIKALNSRGSGSSSNIAQAIVWATDNDAHIINMSLGGLGFGHDTVLSNAISYAYNKGVLVVAAAGNDVAVTGGNLDLNPVFPICHDNGGNMILGVTATDNNDRKPQFANYGKSCIDVSAPGKRILSTTNHDPATGSVAPNAYAYASGTSMAVPYVVAQAALLKSLFPNSTNKQLRDRIISTAKNIDALNTTQCQGACSGLLGAGRIDVAESLAEDIVTLKIEEGDVVRVEQTRQVFYISGGKRHLISDFVRQQRFANSPIVTVDLSDIANFPEGSYAEPLDGTLLKEQASPTVYYMSKGLRLPVTYQVFQMRQFSFIQVNVLSLAEINSWVTGSFLTPPEGALVRTAKNPTVYWVVGNALHPVNATFYRDRGLQVFPVVNISEEDLKNLPKGEAFIL
jgi:subtilisin family serine protease